MIFSNRVGGSKFCFARVISAPAGDIFHFSHGTFVKQNELKLPYRRTGPFVFPCSHTSISITGFRFVLSVFCARPIAGLSIPGFYSVDHERHLMLSARSVRFKGAPFCAGCHYRAPQL